MMKPVFSKPFDIEHARAGAPIGTVGGDAVEILKWKYRVSEGVNHILGLIITAQCEIPSAWKFDGTMPHGYANSANRYLVMLPLGLIDGKPVFVGDELIDPSGAVFVPGPANSGHLSGCRWPAPAKVYPETTMTEDDLWAAQRQADGGGGTVAEFRAIANAALRRAIDAGQVVAISEAKPGLRPHDPYTGKLRDPRDIETDPMGVLVRHPNEPLKSIEGRAARDIAIADAVRVAALCGHPIARGNVASEDCQALWRHIRDLDLATIISTVK